ncbi:MAG: hypothetical protein K2N25_03175 [Muribaculaceae bacterium]|nr:hypothetical protein [Muribaculaceae bacterium]
MKKERIAGLVPACKIGGVALALFMLVGIASCGDKKTAASETTSVEETVEVAEDQSVDEEVSNEVVAEDAVSDEVKTDEGASASSSSEDWNKVLDEYEKYCDKVVAVAKKAKAGDISAVTEYASLVESAESLQKKLENAGSELTAAQAARMSKIAAKMAQAMM